MKFLIIGLGSAGQRHARVIRQFFPEALIRAFVGKHKVGLIAEDLQSIDYKTSPFQHYKIEELLTLDDLDESFDLAIVATPIATHEFYFEKVFEYSKRVLIEKPIEMSHAKSLQMVNQAIKNDIPLLVGYQHNFNPITKVILDQIKTRGQPEAISIKFHEYLRDMNRFRDMNQHHLARANGGGVILALSHELDFVLQAINSGMPQIEFNLHSSGEFPNVIDEAKIRCFMGNESTKLTEVNISLSYSNVARERIGGIAWKTSMLDWNFFTGELSLSSNGSMEFKEIHQLSGDKLIALQLLFFLNKSHLDDDLRQRLGRAVEIVRLNELAIGQSLN